MDVNTKKGIGIGIGIGIILFIFLILTIGPMLGCAQLKFYDEKGNETKIKFYYPKPYLLVSLPENQEKPVQASIIYLPDRSKPISAQMSSGWGSAELSLAFQNGILTNVGQKTDTKIPETITALVSKIPTKEKPTKDGNKLQFELYEIDNTQSPTVLIKAIWKKTAK